MAGTFCLVLHGHLPWVLHHGRWPHGEDWLFEAASETWLPLLEVAREARAEGLVLGWTLGLTPILLEQLGSTRFREGFRVYLIDLAARAVADEAEFVAAKQEHLAWLAREHQRHLSGQLARFDELGGDLAGAFGELAAAGAIEILSSNATHGYHPLILHDACARAQVRAGLAASERHTGVTPRGVWLPECAYRPDGAWTPAAIHGDRRERDGVAETFAAEGVRFFFVDTHLVRGASPVATLDGPVATPVPPEQVDWDHRRAWRSELEPHRVVEGGRVLPLTVLARCPDVSEQVWSGVIGYPGDGRYLEFHKRHGLRGLRYWRVTGPDAALGDKEPYHPDAVVEATRKQAEHFVALVRARLGRHHQHTGRSGIVCAPFDAELFGHWWHEGPRFLLEVARRLALEPDVEVATVSVALERTPADKAVRLPEGTWGAGGDHRVWLNDELRFYWEMAYRAEDRFIDLWHRADWERDPAVEELLLEGGRQLLLLQASDWAFVISTGGAVDYGLRRIAGHASHVDDLLNGVEDLVAGRPADPVVRSTLERCRALDPVFPDLSLQWWS
jgi:1,4-alpha-glucan branching enzyme